MLTVFPGVDDVRAKSLRSTNIFISDDFPTLLLPIKANSGKLPLGQPARFEAAILNSADFISICYKSAINI
jgi:hypothetical protein